MNQLIKNANTLSIKYKKKLLVPYNKLSVVYVNYESNIETGKCNICFKAKKKTSLSLNILNL